MRLAGAADRQFVVRVEAAVHEADSQDTDFFRPNTGSRGDAWVVTWFVLAADRRSAGYAFFRHPVWALWPALARAATIGAELLPRARVDGLGPAFEAIELRPEIAECPIFLTKARDNDDIKVRLLTRLGYREVSRLVRWELDLGRHFDRLRLLEAKSTKELAANGVRLATLAATRAGSEKLRRLREAVLAECGAVEATHSHNDFRTWLSTVGIHPDRVWLAECAGDAVGVSAMRYAPRAHAISTYWTATQPEARHRGIATALKLKTIVQAKDFGIRLVRSEAEPSNEAVARMNERLGYVRRPDLIELGKFRAASGRPRP